MAMVTTPGSYGGKSETALFESIPLVSEADTRGPDTDNYVNSSVLIKTRAPTQATAA